MMPQGSPSWIGFISLSIAVAIAIGLLVLIAFKKTRTVGLFLSAGSLFVAIFLGYWLLAARHEANEPAVLYKGAVLLEHTGYGPGSITLRASQGPPGRFEMLSRNMSKGVVVGLLTTLVIGGGLLAGGQRTRAITVRVLTILGMTMGVAAVAFFFVSIPASRHLAVFPEMRVHHFGRSVAVKSIETPMGIDGRHDASKPPSEVAAAAHGADTTHGKSDSGNDRSPHGSSDSPENPVSNADVVAEESTAPKGPAKPSWVDAPAHLEGKEYRISVSSGPWATILECERALDGAMRGATEEYIESYLGEGAAQLVSIEPGFIKQRLQREEFAETTSASVGPMQQVHALLVFDDPVREYIHTKWRASVVANRLMFMSCGLALVFLLLGTLFGYLKLDLMTQGAQRQRLQLAATVVILVAAAGALAFRSYF